MNEQKVVTIRLIEKIAESAPRCRVPLETSPDKVEEERVVAALERRLQFARARRSARLPAPRPAAVQDSRVVRQRRDRAVARVS
jgi:hypothetical protein